MFSKPHHFGSPPVGFLFSLRVCGRALGSRGAEASQRKTSIVQHQLCFESSDCSGHSEAGYECLCVVSSVGEEGRVACVRVCGCV